MTLRPDPPKVTESTVQNVIRRGRPPMAVKKNDNRTGVLLRLTKELIDRLDDAAYKARTDRHTLIVALLETGVKAPKRKKETTR